MSTDEFEGAMGSRMAQSFLASAGKQQRKSRKSRERASARTSKERKRGTPRTELINFKTTLDMRQLLRQLAQSNSTTMTDIIEQGIKELAKKQGVAQLPNRI